MNLHDELTALVFGGSEEAIAVAREHLANCAECQAAYAHVSVALSETSPTPSAPPGVRVKLLDRARNSRRMLVYADRLAHLFGLEPVVAESVLNKAYDDASWRTIGPGLSFFKVAGAGEKAKHECVLLRLEPGAEFPEHAHAFGEHVLVLQGAFRDSGGEEVWRGESAYNGQGTKHSLTALEGENCIAAVVTLKEKAA